MNTKIIEDVIYGNVDADAFLSQCTDSKELHIYAFNYNWGDGFKIPQKIASHPECSLSTALQMFFDADGCEYLDDKDIEVDDWQSAWIEFVKVLYERIINRDFKSADIAFEPPLDKSDVIAYKEELSDEEQIFMDCIEGENCCINL